MANVARAKQLAERFGVHEAHPRDYIELLSKDEGRDWDDLLDQIK